MDTERGANESKLLAVTAEVERVAARLLPDVEALAEVNTPAVVGLETAVVDRIVEPHPEPHTHVELCRSNELQDKGAVMNVPLIDGGPHRLRRFIVEQVRRPGPLLRTRRLKDSS